MRNAPAGYGWRLSTPFGGARAPQRRARLCRRWIPDGWMDGWNSELRVLSTFLCRSIHKKRDSAYHLDGSRTVNVSCTQKRFSVIVSKQNAFEFIILGDCTFVFLSLFTHIKSTPRKTARIHRRVEGHERRIDNPRVRFIRSIRSVDDVRDVTRCDVTTQHTRDRSVDRVRGTRPRAGCRMTTTISTTRIASGLRESANPIEETILND